MDKLANLIISVLFFLNMFFWYDYYQIYNLSDNLEIYFLDVGQGDAILIKTPNNKFGLIDGGRGSSVTQEMSKYLPSSVSELEFVVFTHPDADHIEGLIPVLKKYKVKNAFIHKVNKDSSLYTEVIQIIDEKEIKNYAITDVTDFTLDNVYFDTVWPNSNLKVYSIDDVNETSISFLIKYKDFKIFLGGDLGYEYEEQSVSTYTNLDIDILKTGHHGSTTSTSQAFLEYTKPEVAIISAGKNNSYGHPANEILERLKINKIKVYRTDKNGTIVLETNGEEYWIE